MKFIIGTKIEMTQVWRGDKAIAVTKVQANPCTVTQVKTTDKDGYQAVQLGFGEKKKKNMKKPQAGHLKGLGDIRYMREFRTEEGELKKGDKIDVNTFVAGDIVRVTSTSKGKGFQGVVKRHGFKGSKMTHGNKDQGRMPGSIGATGPAHVFKGTRMGGRMGGDQVTTTNLEIIEVDKDNNILLVKGAVPGGRNGLVLIKGEGELKIMEEVKESVKNPEPAEEKIASKETETKQEEAPKKEEKVEDPSTSFDTTQDKSSGQEKDDKKIENKDEKSEDKKDVSSEALAKEETKPETEKKAEDKK